MADAEGISTNKKFYCHKCAREVSPRLPEFICPHCDNGFIEEIQTGSGSSGSERDDVQYIQPAPGNQMADVANILFGMLNAHTAQANHPQTQASGSNPGRGGGSVFISSNPSRDLQVGSIEHLLSSILTGLQGPWLGQGNMEIPITFLHGNPADYAWGQGGLDEIVTRLLNQFEGAGPPPVPKEKIDSIKELEITQSHIDTSTQCPVCMSDFALGERVKKLPQCDHLFHSPCIIPWLELHDSCPVCRKPMMPGATDSSLFSSPSPSSSQGPPPPPNRPPPRRDLDFLDEYD